MHETKTFVLMNRRNKITFIAWSPDDANVMVSTTKTRFKPIREYGANYIEGQDGVRLVEGGAEAFS